MTRFCIQFTKPGIILPIVPEDGIASIIAPSGRRSEITVYVLQEAVEEFWKKLEKNDTVVSYTMHPAASEAVA